MSYRDQNLENQIGRAEDRVYELCEERDALKARVEELEAELSNQASRFSVKSSVQQGEIREQKARAEKAEKRVREWESGQAQRYIIEEREKAEAEVDRLREQTKVQSALNLQDCRRADTLRDRLIRARGVARYNRDLVCDGYRPLDGYAEILAILTEEEEKP